MLPRQRVQAFVCGELPPTASKPFWRRLQGGQTAPPAPGRIFFLLRDLPPDERERVLTAVLKRRLSRWESDAHRLLEEGMPLVEQCQLGPPLVGPGRGDALDAAHALNDAARARRRDFGAVDRRSVLTRGAAGLDVISAGAEAAWSLGAANLLDVLEKDFSQPPLRELRDGAEVATLAGLGEWRPAAQTRFFRLLERCGEHSSLALEVAAALGIAIKKTEPA